MARYSGPIKVWSRDDTTPIDAEGGYAGGDSTAAAVGAALDQSSRALGTVDNLAVTAETVEYGEPATATISGTSPNRSIHLRIPKGMTETAAADIVIEAQAAAASSEQSNLESQQAAADAATALQAQFLTQDDGVATLINDDTAGPLTNSALTKFMPWIDPHVEHAAVGDGVTDDAAALQAALVAARDSTFRKTVKLRRGTTYALGTHVTIYDGTHLDGNGATLRPLASSTMRAVQISGSRVLVTDLTIDMNRAATTNGGNNGNQQGILINAAAASLTDVTLRRVTVINSHQRGIAAQSSGAYTINDITVENCLVADVGGRGIHIGGSGAATNRTINVRGCRVLRPVEYAIICQGVSDAHVTNCHAAGDATSVNSGIVMSATNALSTDFSVTGCTVTGFNAAIRWGITATWGAERFHLDGNIVTDCAGGISIDPERHDMVAVEIPVAATVRGNTVKGTTTQHGINVRMCNGVTVAGNTVEDIYDRGIIVSTATGVAITGNSVARTGSDGIGLFGTTAGGGHVVGPNVIRDWGTRVAALAVRDGGTPIDNAFVTTSATP